MSANNFKTCGDARQYCEKYGLYNIRAIYSFQTAEALLRAYKDGASSGAENGNDEIDRNHELRDKIKRKLKVLRMREQQAIEDKNFTECIRLDGAIFHIEDLYQYAMSNIQSPKQLHQAVLPQGTIICPHCGVTHSGLLGSIRCDECDKPFWPLHVIRRQLNYQLKKRKLNENI